MADFTAPSVNAYIPSSGLGVPLFPKTHAASPGRARAFLREQSEQYKGDLLRTHALQQQANQAANTLEYAKQLSDASKGTVAGFGALGDMPGMRQYLRQLGIPQEALFAAQSAQSPMLANAKTIAETRGLLGDVGLFGDQRQGVSPLDLPTVSMDVDLAQALATQPTVTTVRPNPQGVGRDTRKGFDAGGPPPDFSQTAEQRQTSTAQTGRERLRAVLAAIDQQAKAQGNLTTELSGGTDEAGNRIAVIQVKDARGNTVLEKRFDLDGNELR